MGIAEPKTSPKQQPLFFPYNLPALLGNGLEASEPDGLFRPRHKPRSCVDNGDYRDSGFPDHVTVAPAYRMADPWLVIAGYAILAGIAKKRGI
jgi:hypothetical protein